MRTIDFLTATHNSAALMFALRASVIAERDGTPEELEAYDDASDTMDAAFDALLSYVPADVGELKAKARYLLSRLELGDMIGSEHLPAILRSIAHFRSAEVSN